jgi:hypothetical protein
MLSASEFTCDGGVILPLLGERAGVRAGQCFKHSHFTSATFFSSATGLGCSMVTV